MTAIVAPLSAGVRSRLTFSRLTPARPRVSIRFHAPEARWNAA